MELDALEEVIFVGYPVGLWDTTNLTPILRRGVTATPVFLDFQGKPQFLIDASVFPGSSGSPVFLYSAGWYSKRDGSVVAGKRVKLLGVLSSVVRHLQESRVETIPTGEKGGQYATFREVVDLGFVFKSSTILETIQHFISEKGWPPLK